MSSESSTSHKVVPPNLPDEGVLENLIEAEGVDSAGGYAESRILDDPNSAYVSMSLPSNNQRGDMGHLITEEEHGLFQEQEYVEDPNTNYVTVSIEELQAAGIDIDNISELTEEQIQTLLSISQQNRRASQQQQSSSHFQDAHSSHGSYVTPKNEPSTEFSSTMDHFPVTSDGNAHRSMHQQRSMPQRRPASHSIAPQPVVSQPGPMPTNAMNTAPSTSQPVQEAPPNQITITITDEGHIKLTDAANQTFFFSREDLALRNIDAKNLTDKNIQEIIQMALPSLDVGRGHLPPAAQPPQNHAPMPAQKRRRLDPSGITGEDVMFQHTMPHQNGTQLTQGPSVSTAPMISAPRLQPARGGSTLAQFMPAMQPMSYRQGTLDSMLLGEEVEVTKNGQSSVAIVRYCRPGAGYKVQYPDGHFEWVNESQITKRSLGSNQRAGQAPMKAIARTSEATSPYRVASPSRQVVQAPKKLGDLVGLAGVGRRVPPPVPGIKLGPTPSLKPPSSSDFFCSVCDKHVCQQEPAYIILRLPACTTCADEKIVVLDEEDDEDTESGREEVESQHDQEPPPIEKQGGDSEIRGIRVSASENPENQIQSQQNPVSTSQTEMILSRNMDEHGFPADALAQEDEEVHGSQDFVQQTPSSQESHHLRELTHPEHESFLEPTDSFI